MFSYPIDVPLPANWTAIQAVFFLLFLVCVAIAFCVALERDGSGMRLLTVMAVVSLSAIFINREIIEFNNIKEEETLQLQHAFLDDHRDDFDEKLSFWLEENGTDKDAICGESSIFEDIDMRIRPVSESIICGGFEPGQILFKKSHDHPGSSITFDIKDSNVVVEMDR